MYYRLTYISSSDKSRLGDSMLNGKKPVNIGQGTAYDVQLPESELYEPQLYATILSRDDEDGWYVVRRTDLYRISVNGIELGIAQTLHHGDRLSFEDGTSHTELKFELFDDGEYDPCSGFVYKKYKSNKTLVITTVTLALLAVGIAAYTLFAPKQKDLHHEDLTKFIQSVYHVTCDSVYLLCDSVVDGSLQQVVIESIELEEVTEGTAFLIADSIHEPYFVTARHCIEPWINDDKWDGVSSKANMSPEVRLATMAETRNRLAGNKKYMMRAHCIISKGFERYDYLSTDFHMNKSRDLVMKLGSTKETIYWRTIFPIAHRRDMELGDFAYIAAKNLPSDRKAEVTLAEWDDIVTFAKSQNHDIAVVGYPLNDNDADEATIVYGNLMGFEYNDSLKAPVGCLQLSALINPGNSGGPVIAKIGDEMKVIGIVSKADGRASQGMFWAVPTAEVTTMHRNGDIVKDDSVIYRR